MKDLFRWEHFEKLLQNGMKATNILLQGLPKDIYSLINHYTDAKDIWDNVKMLLEVFWVMGELRTELGSSNYWSSKQVDKTMQLMKDADEQPDSGLSTQFGKCVSKLMIVMRLDYDDVVCEHHEIHERHDDVQPNYVVDLHVDYTSDSNMILYDQYIKDNTVPVVQNNVSSVPNDAYMMILNDMHEPPA
ncbi:hypothetical protein Tco_1493486 [Tanacetum coccineum]